MSNREAARSGKLIVNIWGCGHIFALYIVAVDGVEIVDIDWNE